MVHYLDSYHWEYSKMWSGAVNLQITGRHLCVMLLMMIISMLAKTDFPYYTLF